MYNLDPVLTYDYMNCCDKIPRVQTNEKYLILYAYAGRISNEEAEWISDYAKKKETKGLCNRRYSEMCRPLCGLLSV